MRKRRAKQVFPVKDSSIEVKIQTFLKELIIEFVPHRYMTEIEHGYQCDVFIPSINLVIECDGDFMHCNPSQYPPNFIRFPNSKDNQQAHLIWARDKMRTNELHEAGYKVLRLWEHEIKKLKMEDLGNILSVIAS